MDRLGPFVIDRIGVALLSRLAARRSHNPQVRRSSRLPGTEDRTRLEASRTVGNLGFPVVPPSSTSEHSTPASCLEPNQAAPDMTSD
jgi:hypothetical protein